MSVLRRPLFDSDLDIFRESVGRFLDKEAVPHHAQWEKDGQVSREVWQKAGAQGLLCCPLPEAYGGSDADYRYSAVVSEEMARRGLSGLGFSLHSDIVAPYILHYGSEAQKQKYLPAMARGEIIAAIAMTEPGAGSDLQGLKTTAVRQDDGSFLVNGSKTFITNGAMADVVIIAVKTDPARGAHGISLLLMDADMPGFSRGRNLEKAGLKAQDTSELFFQDVSVPEAQLLGPLNAGFACLMKELVQERLSVGVTAVANAEAGLEWTKAYVKERQAFGRKIGDFQNTRFKLAELQTEVNVARIFLDRCLEMHLAGELDGTMAAQLKYWTTDMQCRVLDECVQLHGGYGYMWEYPITRSWADARVQRIYAGTNEIMKEIIGRSL
jgi:alkylation response protein AidB-like acyl-CoA dehydrogenase